jgi:hypothetical protein
MGKGQPSGARRTLGVHSSADPPAQSAGETCADVVRRAVRHPAAEVVDRTVLWVRARKLLRDVSNPGLAIAL